MAMTLKDIRQKYPDYDDMSDTELADALHSKLYSDLPKEQVYEKLGVPLESQQERAEPEERTGLLGVVSDVAHGIGGARDFALDIPNKLEKSGKYIEEHPGSSILHNAGQLAAEAGDIGKGLINAPYNLNQYLARKHLLPQVLGKLGKKLIPHLPEDMGVEKALGLEADKSKGDDLIRAIPDIASTVLGGGSIAKQVKNIASRPSKEVLFQRALEKGIEDAKVAHNLSEAEVTRLKDALTEQFSSEFGERLGKTTPVGQKESINVKKARMSEIEPQTQILEKEIGEIPPEPDTKAIIAEKKAAAEDARKAAEETLGVLDNPRLKGGAIVQKAIKDVKKSSSDLYDSARNHYVEKKIMADNSKEIKAVTADLEELKAADELAPGYGSGTTEQKALESQLSALKGEQVNASDIFDLQRTLEKMAQDTRKKQYSGVNEIEFKRLGSLAERLDNHADKLATRLEAVGGKEVQSMIKEANKGWKTFKDLEKNNVGKAALNKGEIPSRAMIDIANTQSGNEFLRALTDAYPELKKHMLAAHVGEGSVNKLLKPTTLTKKYLEALPEVEEKVNDLKHAIAGVKEGEVKANNVKKEYDALVTSMKDAAKEQKIRQDAIKESDKLKKQIKFHEDAIPELEKKIKAAQEKGDSAKKLKDELEQHKRDQQDKGSRLKKLGNFILKAKGIQSFGNKLGL